MEAQLTACDPTLQAVEESHPHEEFVQAKLHSINHVKVATEKDFDDVTGELRKESVAKGIFTLTKSNIRNVVSFIALSSDVSFRVEDVDTKTSFRKPPPAFITSSLQQEASYKLGISPSLTMATAQKLYEEGCVHSFVLCSLSIWHKNTHNVIVLCSVVVLAFLPLLGT